MKQIRMLMRMRAPVAALACTSFILTGCGGAGVPESASTATPVPAATIAPAQAPAPTATELASMPTATAAAVLPAPTMDLLKDTNTAKPDDTTQGRLRFNQCVDGAPLADVYVNGHVAVNGGVAQIRLSALTTNGYLYLAPGSYNVALVPSGQGLDHPFLGPLDVQVAAGHRYTVVALGQKEDPTHKALVIDETAAYHAIGGNPPDSLHTAHITVNNIKGSPPITRSPDGKAAEDGVAYGEFKAALWPSFAHSLNTSLTGPPSVLWAHIYGIVANPPAADNMDCLFGTYPDSFDTQTAPNTSVLDPVDFLHSYTELAAGTNTNGYTPTFNTLLSALQETGMTEMIKTGGPYLLLAPTDDAFAALPKDKRDTLLADPKALGDLLRSHIVEGYYPPRSLSPNPPDDSLNRTVTNMLGAPLTLISNDDGLMVNGQPVSGGDTVFVANGTRMIEINKLILPAAQQISATPVAGTPTK